MKRSIPKLLTLLALVSALSMWGVTSTPDTEATDGASSATEVPDSVQEAEIRQADGIMTLSDDGQGPPSFMTGAIPMPPQAASLARYAEYPVSHTTGIPDISIPVYSIDLGGFTLPVSLSYHASGARPDEVPTCVGLGWALNAGGMISRTVQGAPDFYRTDEASTDYTLRDYSSLQTLVRHNDALFRSLAEGDPQYDTESDRYCLNAGGHSMVFRYSHEARKFIVLNHEPCRISVSGYGEETSFTVEFTDGTDWTFSEVECSGVDREGEGHPYVSAWYVTKISTRWGDIDFTYRHGTNLTLVRESDFYTAGTFIEPDVEGRPEEFDRIYRTSSRSSFVVGQTLVESITWNGNRMLFDYSSPWPREVTDRLETIRVVSADGAELKRVSLGNDYYWPSLNAHLYPSDKGRRLLKSVIDSQQGTYTMEYDTHLAMPMLGQMKVDSYSDYYGYYRKSPTGLVSETMRQWLRSAFADQRHCPDIIASADRTPDADAMKTGMLTKITFPTGGHAAFEYAANGPRSGGLHLSAMTLNDGTSDSRRTYSYGGMLQPQEDPHDLMCFETHMCVLGISLPYSSYVHKKAVTSPVYSPFLSSSSVVFTDVVETLPDGSRVTYEYDKDELINRYGVEDGRHPSLYYGSTIDWGNRLPLLKRRSVTDATGKCVFEEVTEYVRNNSRHAFLTGVRVAVEYVCFDWPSKSYDSWGPNAFLIGAFGTRNSVAKVRSASVKKRTEKDLVSGMVKTVSYTYDDSLRTTLPRTVTVTDGTGAALTTEYTYPFDRKDAVCADMTRLGVTDAVVAVRVSSGGRVISSSATDYVWANGFFHPSVARSWSAPTADAVQTPPSVLPERERVSSYNSKGRPLSVKVNETDLTSFTWDSSGVLLQSYTAPGGLTTKYTHKPLFGLASSTLPNGHTTTYGYSSAGLLSSVSDNGGLLSRYSYSIASHPASSMTGAGNSVTTEKSLHYAGSTTVKSRRYFDGLGRPTVLLQGGANTEGKYLYTAVSYDALGRESQTILPSVGGTALGSKTFAQVKTLSASTYDSDQHAWSETTYDALDRPVKVTTPGDAWHSAGKAKTTQYIANAASSVRLYTAPITSTALSTGTYYGEKTLQGVRYVDEDGHEMTVYTDRLGRKVLERRGPESQKGQNDTYFVYNALGQLRFVLSPAYQQDADLTEYAYEYRYDQHGNVVYKSIPGAGYTQYWYDRAGRLAYMQDANLRSKSLYRFFVYDKAGRQAIQGVCKVCTRDETVNFATYAGGTSGFMQTGYTLANASRIQQATLETVSYYDGYTFASALDSDLVKATTQSVKGLLTGSVVYNSDGTKSTSAFYYDAKGQVTESREKTSFGTLRTTTNTYTYSGQPLKTSMTEGSVTLITENTYDSATGLLTATDVTVNGVKRRVSAVTYDDLGRIASVVRGAEQNSGGKVSYTYNLHGQTRSISGPGFSQNLYYADWTGTKLYNGSVSAMTWIMGTDATVRGYKYIYNGYGWLASADYGEGDALTSNRMHYTEKATSFTLNGGVKKLERYGRMSSGTFGKIDDLTVSYSGNRISTVSDAAPAVTQTGSMDYPGGSYLSAFTYSDFGALTSDRSRGISSIIYDNLGNPLKTSFSNGNITHNVYSATGEKLRSDAVQSISGTSISRTITDYRGPVVYRDGKVHMVLFPGGYATINGTAVIFHYYTQDYLGNNRAVINGSTGAIEQTVAYYPYGAVIADLGTNPTTQQYKFGGKELITANGLNEYDFGARNYYPAVPAFTRIDQQCENFQHLSPYLFCGNDPVNNVDPTGKVFETVWDIGNVLYDVGAAIYHHATGDHEAATGNWVDAGLDVVAVIIPGLPAGTSKLLSTGAKTAKNIEKASDVNKGIEIASEIGKTGIEKTAESSRNAAIRAGRSGKQGRLRELGDDPKLGKNDRAWIKQDQKLIKENKRTSIRVPPGKELAHPRGKEAAKGYTYKEAKLQLKSNHKIQHKHDNNGKKNR